MGKGRSLVIFSCYEYKQVHQVSPYNEIAMTTPVLANPSVNIHILPMVIPGVFNKFGYYVFSMPVTSHENQIRGNKLWGLPKVTQEIDFRTEDGFHICHAREENGEPYFELKVPINGKTMQCDESGYLIKNELMGVELQCHSDFGDYDFDFKDLFPGSAIT